MLLIVIVFLLNIVFFWVPIFRICIPVPAEVEVMIADDADLGRGLRLPAPCRPGRPDGVVPG